MGGTVFLTLYSEVSIAAATGSSEGGPGIVSVAWDIVMRKRPSVQMTREIYGRTAPPPFVGADPLVSPGKQSIMHLTKEGDQGRPPGQRWAP